MERLCVFRSGKHIYAQIIGPDGRQVLVSASTIDKKLKDKIKNGGNVSAAVIVGEAVAERAKSAGISCVAFDRSGFKYHGRVKALAEAARSHGLNF